MKSALTTFHNQFSKDIDYLLSNRLDLLSAHPTKLAPAMRYAVLNGGKRMRPLLCGLVAHTVGVKRNDALTLGAAIECIHAYSLVHDDLPAMDDDNLRRGKPTCHIQYDEATAILVGDALQSLAFDILTQPNTLTASGEQIVLLVRELAVASGYEGMCGGQAIDVEATGLSSAVAHTLDNLILLHKLKTGAILKACVSMPLVITHNIDSQAKALFMQFADLIGLAFQVQDDILDCVGDTQQLGKPAGSDDGLNKHTFPALMGLESANAHLQNLYQQALQALDALPYNTQLLKAFCDLMIFRDH